MALSQMNIRIDDKVRAEGNRALANIGFTPARIIRGLWGFAAQNQNNPARMRSALRFIEDQNVEADEKETRARTIEEGWHIAEKGLASLGVLQVSAAPVDLRELKEQAMRERWEARGLL